MLSRARGLAACAALVAAFVSLSLARSLHKPLWRDEVVSVYAAHGSLARAFAIGRGDSSGLLFNPLLHLWMKLAGTQPQLLRALPLLFGVATVIALQRRAWKWIRESGTSAARALLLLAAVSLNPVVVYYSAELRNYAAFSCCATLLGLATERLLRGGRGAIGWLTAASLATLCVNPLGVVWTGCHAAVIACALAARGRWRWLLALAGLAAAALLAFSPVLAQMHARAAELRESSWIVFDKLGSLPEARGVFAPYDQVTLDFRPIELLSAIGAALCVLALFAIARDRAQRGSARFLAIAIAPAGLFVAAIYLCAVLFAPIFFRRYLVCASTSFGALALFGYAHPWLRRRSLFALAALAHAAALSWMLLAVARPDSEVDYARLARSDVPIFTAEDTDVLPCLFYSRACKFVGSPSQIPRNVGAVWFEAEIPFVAAWSDIRAEEFEAVIRPAHRAEVGATLASLGYRAAGPDYAGPLSSISRWRKAQ